MLRGLRVVAASALLLAAAASTCAAAPAPLPLLRLALRLERLRSTTTSSSTPPTAGRSCTATCGPRRASECDPDYDVVRYHYRWTTAGKIVRSVWSAGLSDELARDSARPGQRIRCSVTPSDGKLRAPTASAAATAAG